MTGSYSAVLVVFTVASALLTWSHASTNAAQLHRYQQRDVARQRLPNSMQGQRMNMLNSAQLSQILDPPQRPSSFGSVEELNKYLEDLRQYYALLGRPRFGRSADFKQKMDGLQDS